MSKQLHKLKEVKQPLCLTHDDMRMHKPKRNMLGFYGMSRLCRPYKYSKLTNSPIGTKTKNVDNPVQKRKTITNKVDWSSDDYFSLLKAAIDAYLNGYTKQGSLLTNVVVTERTLKRPAAILSEIMDRGENAIDFENITVGMVYPNANKGSLLGETDLKLLQYIIVSRDEANNGAGRAKIVALIGDIAQCSDLIKCRNHWNYIVMLGKLKELKGGGRLRKAQNTTTKRTQITVEQQLLWHTTMYSSIDELKRLNQPNERFVDVIEYFIVNLYESCLMSANGKIYVVSSSGKNKNDKISDDCRESITTVRSGFTSGQQGAYFFLSKVKNLDRYKFKNLHKFFKAPEGSEVVMDPNAFMNDEAWLEIITKLCKSIWRQEIIRDHPDWWVLLSLDGLTSHVNVLNSQEIFAELKIMVIKEEGDTSHVCQAYDKQVALTRVQ